LKSGVKTPISNAQPKEKSFGRHRTDRSNGVWLMGQWSAGIYATSTWQTIGRAGAMNLCVAEAA